jgi:CRP-like cAMP-binding protein
LPTQRAHEVARLCQPQAVRRGAFLFHEGAVADTLYFLVEGQIKVIRETEDGQEVILRMLGPGELFGAVGGWGVATYPATAFAVEDAVVLRLPASAFAALLMTQPDLGLALVRELAERLREAESRIIELQTQRAERRLAWTLLRLANKTGSRSATGIAIGMPLSRQDLAELTGMTIGTVSRTLSAWERRGLVVTGRERIEIREPHGLVALAEDAPLDHEGQER